MVLVIPFSSDRALLTSCTATRGNQAQHNMGCQECSSLWAHTHIFAIPNSADRRTTDGTPCTCELELLLLHACYGGPFTTFQGLRNWGPGPATHYLHCVNTGLRNVHNCRLPLPPVDCAAQTQAFAKFCQVLLDAADRGTKPFGAFECAEAQVLLMLQVDTR